MKKEFQKLFRQHSLNFIIKCKLKIADFLEVTLNLTDSTYKPYHKPNDEIFYIHKESNLPPSIKKPLPVSIETRLSKISSDGKVPIKQAPITPTVDNEKGISSGLTHRSVNL